MPVFVFQTTSEKATRFMEDLVRSLREEEGLILPKIPRRRNAKSTDRTLPTEAAPAAEAE